MSNSFDVFWRQLQSGSNIKTFDEKCYYCSQKDLSKEFRKILDKIAVEILYLRFENENMIQAILELSRVERIVVIFHIILGMTNEETAFLLDADINSFYVYKSRAFQKLKRIIEHNDLFY